MGFVQVEAAELVGVGDLGEGFGWEQPLPHQFFGGAFVFGFQGVRQEGSGIAVVSSPRKPSNHWLAGTHGATQEAAASLQMSLAIPG